jgi:hypothetical protein
VYLVSVEGGAKSRKKAAQAAVGFLLKVFAL